MLMVVCFHHRLQKGKGTIKMTNEKKKELLADCWGCDVDVLGEDAVLEDLDEWDSMNMLALIVLMDDEFGKELTRDDINGFKTVGDILEFMG